METPELSRRQVLLGALGLAVVAPVLRVLPHVPVPTPQYLTTPAVHPEAFAAYSQALKEMYSSVSIEDLTCSPGLKAWLPEPGADPVLDDNAGT